MSTATAGAPRTAPPAPAQGSPPTPPAASGPAGHLAAALCAVPATLVAVLGAAASLHGVISDWGWLLQVAVVAGCIVLAANLARAAGARRHLATVAGAVAAVLVLTVLFFSNTAWLGVFPTDDTYRALLRVWAEANAQMGSQVPPVQTTGVIVFSVCVWVAVATLAVDTLAFEIRAPALAGVPLAMLLALASLFEPRGAGLGTVAVTAVGYLLVLAAAGIQPAGRDRIRRAAEVAGTSPGTGSGTPAGNRRYGSALQGVVLVAGALVALLVLPIAVPGFSKGMLTEGTRPTWGRPATNIDPIIALGNDLRSRASGTVLHYFSDSKTPTYLRTSVIGNLTAERWAPDPDAYRVPATESLVTRAFPTVFESAQAVFTRVVTDTYRGAWMPMPENAITLNGLDTGWGWSPDTGTLRAAEGRTPEAEDYTVMSVAPLITREVLEGLDGALPRGFFAEVEAEYLELPEDTPQAVAEAVDTALEAAGSGPESNAYEQAVAIQNHLRSAAFTYSENTPVQDGYDGSGMRVIEAFLQKKSGYCVHFASAMALMARDLGIPSRLVTGYSPGNPTGLSITGQDGAELNEFTVDSRNAHAWPELYFPGVGWVGFEPTPGRGIPPAYAPALPAPSASAGGDLPVESRRNRESAASSTSASPSAGAAVPGQGPGAGPPVAYTLFGLLLVLLAGMVPWQLRRLQRAGRMARLRRPGTVDARYGKETGAAAAWAELVAVGLDAGWPMRQDESAGDYARRLSRTFPQAAAPLAVLAGCYERLRYASGGPDADPEALGRALADVRHALAMGTGPGERLGRTLWPRSLVAPRPPASPGYASGR